MTFHVGQKVARQRAFEASFIPEPNSGCWLWLGTTNNRGYGVLQVGGRCYAHRFAYEEFRGPIPPGMLVCHQCDNPPCCNPDHLFLGTQKDNMADCRAKGRHASVTSPNSYIRGDRVAVSKLTANQVLAIRQLKGTKSERAIAREFGVARNSIRLIIQNRTWRHV